MVKMNPNIDFISHIGIGNSEDVLVCKKNINRLNTQNLLVNGSVQVLDIVKYENYKIETIEKVDLLYKASNNNIEYNRRKYEVSIQAK